ncbi:MAG: S-layer family protein [Cyanobacteriota bacterium]
MGSSFQRQPCRAIGMASSFFLSLLGLGPIAQSQILPDGTLPNNTIVNSNGNVSVIEGGTKVGGNLFHSFQEFSLLTGNQAIFNNALDIQNILSRVTGLKTSNIDGLIQAHGTANLFFINPSGIVFGLNAQLNIGGSFIGSTANSINLADGNEFSAINPQAPPLLTINVPIGLQFGSTPGTIVNQSQVSNNAGLQVLPGRTLALIGGDVILNGGNLTAAQGQIELGSVASSGLVNLTSTSTNLTFEYQNIPNFGNIQLTGKAAVNANGLGGGTIRLRGGQVTLTQGSKLVAETFGNFNGGGIDIQATRFNLQQGAFVSTSTFGSGAGGNLRVNADIVELTGTTPLKTSGQLLIGTFNPLDLSDGLFSLSAGSGNAGEITINASQLKIDNGANLFTPALLSGGGGNLTLNVSELAELSNGSLLFAGTAGTGNAGNLAIAAKLLRVLSGTSLSTTPGGTSGGRGGNITVTAELVELRETPAGAFVPAGLFTTTLGAGDAGDLTVTANQLVVADGAQISTSSSGQGRGGDLTVTADTIELNGKSADGRFLGGLLASSSLVTVPGQQGNSPAGNLTVTTRRLSVSNGAQISAATGNAGTAGILNVNASESVDVRGFATNVELSVEAVSFGVIGDGIVPSAIETNTRGAGNAGDLTIQTQQLTVRDGAEVGVRSTSTGSAGNLNVRADSIELNEQGTLSAVNVSGSKGGNINLQVRNDIVLRDRSQISTRAGTEQTGGGDGGDITIDTGVLAVVEKSSINANAFQGSGGNIRITTRGILISPDSAITASSKLGVNGVVEINRLGVDPSQGLAQLPENVSDPSDRIATDCAADTGSSLVMTGRGGLPEDPTQPLRGRTVWRDLRDLSAVPSSISLTRENNHPQSPISNRQAPLIEAQGWVINSEGQIELVADVSPSTPHSSWSRPAQCHTPLEKTSRNL